jgi:hypothetical protein
MTLGEGDSLIPPNLEMSSHGARWLVSYKPPAPINSIAKDAAW